MPYGWQDHLNELRLNTDGSVTEQFSVENDSGVLGKEQALKLFPRMEESVDQHSFLLPVKMAHTYPIVNRRGRSITYPTAKRSIDEARGSVVNFDHIMSDRDKDLDTICGRVVDCNIGDVSKELEMLQSTPIYALLSLYKRSALSREVIKEQASMRNWFTSMECLHNFREGCFKVDNDIIPVEEADEELLRCFDVNTIKSYKGKRTSFILGGMDGKVSYQGIGLTKSPADPEASIMNVFLLSDAANIENKKPGLIYGKKVRDNSSIEVIGTTEVSDGHTHDVLSDGTVMPHADGHSHYVEHFSLTPGSDKTYTAVTSASVRSMDTEVNEYPYNEKRHSHLIALNLKKKIKENKTETVNLGGIVMPLSDKASLSVTKKISTFQVEDGFVKVKPESLIELCSEAAEIETQEVVKTKVESGELLEKEKHEEEVKAKSEEAATKAKEETKAEIEAEQKKAKEEEDALKAIIESRTTLFKEKGYELGDKIGEGEEAKTVESIIAEYGADDVSKKYFELYIKGLPAKKAVEQKVEAANTGKSRSMESLLSMLKNDQTASKKNEEEDKPKFGRHALKTRYGS